jgi:hypothetical protein
MLEIDTTAGTLTVSIWAVGAASAVFLAAIMLAIGRAGAVTGMGALFRVGIVAVAISAGWFYIQHTEQRERATERRALDERSAMLLTRAAAPGSALACLDELAGETVEVACEKVVFASPESIAAAAAYVAAKLALLADEDDYARRVNRTFVAELAPLRTSLELDRFGIVAHVLALRYGCTADKCDALTLLGDHSHVLANLRDGAFDEQVAKFASSWNSPSRTVLDGGAAVTSAAALPLAPSPAPAAVSPRYDFPSSQSIPPINIMVPETSAPRAAAPGGQPPAASGGDGNSRTVTTPMPPRRPPQGRTPTAARPSTPRPPVAPVAAGETPTTDDSATSPPTASTPAQ